MFFKLKLTFTHPFKIPVNRVFWVFKTSFWVWMKIFWLYSPVFAICNQVFPFEPKYWFTSKCSPGFSDFAAAILELKNITQFMNIGLLLNVKSIENKLNCTIIICNYTYNWSMIIHLCTLLIKLACYQIINVIKDFTAN